MADVLDEYASVFYLMLENAETINALESKQQIDLLSSINMTPVAREKFLAKFDETIYGKVTPSSDRINKDREALRQIMRGQIIKK